METRLTRTDATAKHGWNQPCSDNHLAVISDIADWRAVSPFLGLTEAEEIATYQHILYLLERESNNSLDEEGTISTLFYNVQHYSFQKHAMMC